MGAIKSPIRIYSFSVTFKPELLYKELYVYIRQKVPFRFSVIIRMFRRCYNSIIDVKTTVFHQLLFHAFVRFDFLAK